MKVGISVWRGGIYHGHRKGELFRDGCDVWRCDSASKRANYESSTLMARFRLQRDAAAWLAFKRGDK